MIMPSFSPGCFTTEISLNPTGSGSCWTVSFITWATPWSRWLSWWSWWSCLIWFQSGLDLNLSLFLVLSMSLINCFWPGNVVAAPWPLLGGWQSWCPWCSLQGLGPPSEVCLERILIIGMAEITMEEKMMVEEKMMRSKHTCCSSCASRDDFADVDSLGWGGFNLYLYLYSLGLEGFNHYLYLYSLGWEDFNLNIKNICLTRYPLKAFSFSPFKHLKNCAPFHRIFQSSNLLVHPTFFCISLTMTSCNF